MRISDWSSDVCSSDLAVWDEMKENALLSTTAVARGMDGRLVESGGAAQVARLLDEWAGQDDAVELHLAAHSAGSILLAPLLQLLTSKGQIIGGPAHGMLGMERRNASVNLWALAITMDMFLMRYVTATRPEARRGGKEWVRTGEARGGAER